MTRPELLDKLAEAFAHEEGFFVTQTEALRHKQKFPTRAQRNCNPGNIRQWRDVKNTPYPDDNEPGQYVDFVKWASITHPEADPSELRQIALTEGWRVMKRLLGSYIDGHYHGHAPTLREICWKYAPSTDNNRPLEYAAHVAARCGIPDDVPVLTLIS
jgi:hypothetical protein